MPLFPSLEWMQEFCTHLADHPDAGATARALDGVYQFVVEPAPPLLERQTYNVEIRPNGDGAAVGLATDAEHPRLTITATYDRWRQLLRGELDLAMAVMLRRLRVSGDVMGLRRNLGSARALTEALEAVDTQWLED